MSPTLSNPDLTPVTHADLAALEATVRRLRRRVAMLTWVAQTALGLGVGLLLAVGALWQRLGLVP